MFDIEYNQETKNDNKKEKTNYKRNSNFSFHSKRILIFILVFIIVGLLVYYYLYKNYYSNYNYIKQERDNYLVYTKDSFKNSEGMMCEIPFININSSDATLVNETISKFVSEFLKNKHNLFVYDSEINGEVLSVLIKMLDYSAGYSYPNTKFHTYNFDLKSQTLLSNTDLLALYNISEADVLKKIKGQFKSYYNDEVSKGFLVSDECDYDCFLNWRGVDDYMDSVYYYVKDGKLIAYKSFNIYSVYGEEEYFDESSYQFYISG